MRDNHVKFNTKLLDAYEKVREFNGDYNQYSKQLRIPSYLPFTEGRESECTIDEFDPKENSHHSMNGLLMLMVASLMLICHPLK